MLHGISQTHPFLPSLPFSSSEGQNTHTAPSPKKETSGVHFVVFGQSNLRQI